MEDTIFSTAHHHQRLLRKIPVTLAYQAGMDPYIWADQLRQKLSEVLAIENIDRPNLNAVIKKISEQDDHTLFRIAYTAEKDVRVPGYLLIPKQAKPPYPVMICLQGHAKEGMKLSLDPQARGGRGFAAAAIKYGWAALTLEQRCFGERAANCAQEAMHALQLGKTLTGERVLDVIRAIDFLETQENLDETQIGCMGQSTGGTVSFYAACLDQRIRMAVVSSSFCTYADSWMKHPHCPCGYLPGILKYADMSDLGGLIAPRHLLIVAGKNDAIASYAGVQQAFDHTSDIFRAFGCPKNVKIVVGNGGHDFYPDLAWPIINQTRSNWTSDVTETT